MKRSQASPLLQVSAIPMWQLAKQKPAVVVGFVREGA